MKFCKNMGAFFLACFLTVSFMGMQVSATSITSNNISVVKHGDIESKNIEPRKDKIDWVYKSEDGRVYRRLFNFSKNEWIGDWEVC